MRLAGDVLGLALSLGNITTSPMDSPPVLVRNLIYIISIILLKNKNQENN
jgi:hypothetical protein